MSNGNGVTAAISNAAGSVGEKASEIGGAIADKASQVAKAAKKEDALQGLERWKDRHPEAAPYIKEEDVLVDAMRGRYTTWTRIRVNLRNVPREMRPAQEPPDPD